MIDALVCSEPGRLELVRRPAPHRDAGRVLVRPRRVGICGTDYHIYEGKHPFLQYPRVMGHELAVEVIEAPEGSGLSPGETCVVNPYLSCGHCSACRIGKPNCCVVISVLGVHEDGGMAGLLSVPPGNLIHARGLSIDKCATVEFLAIGAHAIRRGRVAKGHRVLVVGAGPIGFGVLLFAKLSGANVAVLDRDLDRVNIACEIAGVAPIGVDSDPDRQIEAFTNGEGFDVVFDATGNPRAMEHGFEFVGHGGDYVFVSVVKEAISFTDPDFHRKEMTLRASRNATMEDFERVMSAMRQGQIPVERLITHRTNLRDAVRDIPLWAESKTGLIKALIEIGN
jgi:2-desacetyl-2-hydroxyethyl bacteriochlorophyllide A dehydrogenase